MLITLPVASKIGLGAWHSMSSFVGLAKKSLIIFHIGLLVFVLCWKEKDPGPSVVPAAKL